MKYVIIGGQYEVFGTQCFESLHAAKIYASRHAEYWDNMQGWHVPKIYSLDDCEKRIASGYITIREGLEIYIPKLYAVPYCTKKDSKWTLSK